MSFCVLFFTGTYVVSANEYRCVITSTKAAGCEAYFDSTHSCNFSDELNILRTEEVKTNSLTYPEFCAATCADESGIPKHCRAGRISTVQLEVDNEDLTKGEVLTENTILENAYYGAKLTFVKFWNWLVIATKGESFEIKPMSTPVAGVRG